MQYIIAVIDRAELQRYLNVSEVDSLTDQDLQDIAATMQDELNELGFWDQLVFVTRLKLAKKRVASHAIPSSD